jgi:hypothetical protein
MSISRHTYVDFSKLNTMPTVASDTGAIMTAADNQVDYWTINGSQFEIEQHGAAGSATFTHTASGWQIPVGGTNGNGITICQGSTNIASTRNKYTTGTDGFYLKVKFEQTVLADTDVVMVGFREAGTTQATSTPATALTDYDHKVLFGVVDNAGAMACYSSTGAGSDTNTTPTNVLNVSGTAITVEVRVSEARLVSVLVDGTADALVATAALTLTTGKVLVPHMAITSTGAGAEKVELVSWECGLLAT